MKKIYLTGLLLLLTSLTITSAPVTPNRAKAIAAQYLIRVTEGHKVAPAAKTLSLAYTGKDAKALCVQQWAERRIRDHRW